MARKRDIFRFFDKGPRIICPDCGEKTIFISGSLLGDISQSSVVDEDVLRRLYQDTAPGVFEELCSECHYGEERIVMWLEVDPGRIRGPICRRCFYRFLSFEFGGDREASADVRIYFIRNNKTTLQTLQELADVFYDDEEDEEEPIDPLLLF